MIKKIKFSKITIVIFITVLIWVWADLALDETLPDKSAIVVVDESVARQLWISFDQSPSADIKITLSGPHTAVTTMDRELRKRQKPLEFVLNAVQEQMDRPGIHSLKLLEFLRKDRQLIRRGLMVQSCDPNELSVNVVELAKRSLAVECFDVSGNPLKIKSIEPSKVDAFVPVDSRLTPKVILTRVEIEEARKAPKRKTPYIELSPGHIRESTTDVEIMLVPEENPLTAQRIQEPTIVPAMSSALWAQYYPDIINIEELMGNPINVRATEDAKEAYEDQQLPHMTLYIFESDIKESLEGLRKAVHYNFPEKYVRTGEIELVGEPAIAEFKLIPRPSAEGQ